MLWVRADWMQIYLWIESKYLKPLKHGDISIDHSKTVMLSWKLYTRDRTISWCKTQTNTDREILNTARSMAWWVLCWWQHFDVLFSSKWETAAGTTACHWLSHKGCITPDRNTISPILERNYCKFKALLLFGIVP